MFIADNLCGWCQILSEYICKSSGWLMLCICCWVLQIVVSLVFLRWPGWQLPRRNARKISKGKEPASDAPQPDCTREKQTDCWYQGMFVYIHTQFLFTSLAPDNFEVFYGGQEEWSCQSTNVLRVNYDTFYTLSRNQICQHHSWFLSLNSFTMYTWAEVTGTFWKVWWTHWWTEEEIWEGNSGQGTHGPRER